MSKRQAWTKLCCNLDIACLRHHVHGNFQFVWLLEGLMHIVFVTTFAAEAASSGFAFSPRLC